MWKTIRLAQPKPWKQAFIEQPSTPRMVSLQVPSRLGTIFLWLEGIPNSNERNERSSAKRWRCRVHGYGK